MSTNVDHFTPLSRAVASIGRDAYAERFAIYDREYKAMLRRLATVQPPPSAVDLIREEKAFHDAVRRVEFGADDAPTLVPPDEPVTDASPARLRALVADARATNDAQVWPRPRPVKSELVAEPSEHSGAEIDAVLPIENRPRRSLTRRVGERMTLGLLLLAFLGLMRLIGPKAETTGTIRAASAEAGAISDASAGLQPPPAWIAPQIFSAEMPLHPLPPAIPMPQLAPQAATPQAAAPQAVAPQAQAAAPLPPNQIRLPVPRPDF